MDRYLTIPAWRERSTFTTIQLTCSTVMKEAAMHACLLVIDAQESFRHRNYWNAALADSYLAEQNTLIAEAVSRNIPIVRVLHSDGPEVADNPFALTSGLVRPLEGLQDFAAAASFTKHRHSALVDTGLAVWLTENHMHRLIVSGIRTEQCCETTARHASDLGWAVDYVLDATLTFDMIQPDGKPLRAADIKMRTATVLEGRFTRVCSVAQAFSS